MRKIVINPAYEGLDSLRDLVKAIDERFPEGDLIQKGSRNELRRLALDGVEGGRVVVKHFGRPNPINRVAYTFLRAPKGVRAYRYALRVREAGFDTPAPLAYVEHRRGGLVADSYLVSTECPYSRRFYEFGDADASSARDIIRAFTRRTAAFHAAGMLHKDFSPGNILFDRVDGEWRFAIVDINRMRFGTVSLERRCANFARLWGSLDFFRIIADEYARCRHADADYCFSLIRRARRRFWVRFARRHRVKYHLEL